MRCSFAFCVIVECICIADASACSLSGDRWWCFFNREVCAAVYAAFQVTSAPSSAFSGLRGRPDRLATLLMASALRGEF